MPFNALIVRAEFGGLFTLFDICVILTFGAALYFASGFPGVELWTGYSLNCGSGLSLGGSALETGMGAIHPRPMLGVLTSLVVGSASTLGGVPASCRRVTSYTVGSALLVVVHTLFVALVAFRFRELVAGEL